MHFVRKHSDAFIIAGYTVGVFVLGALFAPVLYGWGKWLLDVCQNHGWDRRPSLAWFMVPLGKTQFRGYFDRAALVVALAGLWPLFKALHMRRAEVLGQSNFANGWRQLLTGFALAVALLFIMGAVFLQTGVCGLNAKADWLGLAAPLASAVTVACLEEFLFRGAVLGVLRRSLGTRGAILWTTLLFSTVHFLKPPLDGAIVDVRWWSGFQIIPQLFSGFTKWDHLLAEFLLLAAVGWMLACVRVSTNALWGSIGLHAGWVFGMKYFSKLTLPKHALHDGLFAPWIAENTCKAIVGSYVGLVPVAVILLTGALMLRLCKFSAQEKEIATNSE